MVTHYESFDEPTESTLLGKVFSCECYEEKPEHSEADCWPFTFTYVNHVTGGLASKVQHKLGNLNSPVLFIEHVLTCGYSEYTCENIYNFTLVCGEDCVSFNGDYNSLDNGAQQLIKWLEA